MLKSRKYTFHIVGKIPFILMFGSIMLVAGCKLISKSRTSHRDLIDKTNLTSGPFTVHNADSMITVKNGSVIVPVLPIDESLTGIFDVRIGETGSIRSTGLGQREDYAEGLGGSGGFGSAVGDFPDRNVQAETAAPGPSFEEIATVQALQLKNGLLTYDSLPDFYVNMPVTYKLKIEHDADSSRIEMAISQGRSKYVRQISVSSEMMVRMEPEDPQAFSVMYLSDSIQAILPQTPTAWRWRITPHKEGLHKVTVSADIITRSELSGQLRKSNFTIFEEVVDVKVKPQQEEVVAVPSGSARTGNDVVMGQGWLPWLLIPVGLLIAALAWMFLKRNPKVPVTEPEAREEYRVVSLPSEQVHAIVETTENLVANAETGEALRILLDAFDNEPDPLKADLINLNAQYRLYEREMNNGLEPERAILNRINYSLTNIMGQLRTGVRVPEAVS